MKDIKLLIRELRLLSPTTRVDNLITDFETAIDRLKEELLKQF